MGIRRWIIRLLLACVLAVGMGYLPYRAYGPNGVARALRLERQLRQIDQRNDQLRQQNRVLRQQIQSLKEDRTVLERVARDELGMVRSEDVVFQMH